MSTATDNTTADRERRAELLRECDVEHVQSVKQRLHDGTYPTDDAIEDIVNNGRPGGLVDMLDLTLPNNRIPKQEHNDAS